MVYLAEGKVLTVGLNGQAHALKQLPVQLITTEIGLEAIQWLRCHRFLEAVISRWDLPDMANGELIRRIRGSRPWLPTVVLLDEPYEGREITVRGLGAAAVLPGSVDGYTLLEVMGQILKQNSGKSKRAAVGMT